MTHRSFARDPPTEQAALPGEDEALYIGRDIYIKNGSLGHYVFDYIIPSYNLMGFYDVRGRNCYHIWVYTARMPAKNPPPPQSLDLSFVITNGGSPLGAPLCSGAQPACN